MTYNKWYDLEEMELNFQDLEVNGEKYLMEILSVPSYKLTFEQLVDKIVEKCNLYEGTDVEREINYHLCNLQRKGIVDYKFYITIK